MAVVLWFPNGQNIAQQDTLAVTAVAVGGVLTATINGKSVSYACVTGDTTSTAAAAWQLLLSGTSAPAEFGEVSWTDSGATVTATASTPGVPFTLTGSGSGGATVTLTHATANSSPSDVGNLANWLRGGSPGLPQNGDDVVVANSSVGLLWNLTALVAVQFNSFRRDETFTGQIGLPDQNPLGYIEYRPRRLKFVGGGGALPVVIGFGEGPGCPLERYDVGAQQAAFTVLSGQNVDLLGTNAANTLRVTGGNVSVAARADETSALASASAAQGATLTLGAGVTVSGAVTLVSATANVGCVPGSLALQAGSRATVTGGGTYAAVTADAGSFLSWESAATITALTLSRGSLLDKSGDPRAMTMTSSSIGGDCQIVDPGNSITWTNPAVIDGRVTAGPFIVGSGRTVRVA